METSILERFFPRKYKFENLNTRNEYLDLGIKTQSGKVYRINIRLKTDYPNSLPEVFVVFPLPLVNYEGIEIKGASHHMHTLANDDSLIQICHFKRENWNPNQSLFKIALKARIWFEAYEGHLRTGKVIDDFLNS